MSKNVSNQPLPNLATPSIKNQYQHGKPNKHYRSIFPILCMSRNSQVCEISLTQSAHKDHPFINPLKWKTRTKITIVVLLKSWEGQAVFFTKSMLFVTRAIRFKFLQWKILGLGKNYELKWLTKRNTRLRLFRGHVRIRTDFQWSYA